MARVLVATLGVWVIILDSILSPETPGVGWAIGMTIVIGAALWRR